MSDYTINFKLDSVIWQDVIRSSVHVTFSNLWKFEFEPQDW